LPVARGQSAAPRGVANASRDPAAAEPAEVAKDAALASSRAPAAAVAVPETLRAELRSLDAVRTALARGEAERALRLLEHYDAQFPAGTLRREAEVLRGRAQRAH
jgi:hypothetical protein